MKERKERVNAKDGRWMAGTERPEVSARDGERDMRCDEGYLEWKRETL